MNRFLALLLASTLSCTAVAQARSPAIQSLESGLAGLAGDERPGCAAGVMENGRLIHSSGWGVADLDTKRPITPSTPFNLASMSKQFTGAAVALLIQDGKLSLEDDVRRHLPELPDYGTPIRLRHLLHHMSGLRNHMALAAFQPGRSLPTHEEALALVFRQSAINFEPGSRHQYESPNYVLLAEIVARASGMPFEQFLEERIFRPLGMRNTGFEVPGLARAYAASQDGSFRLNEAVNRARGSSGLISTVEDLAIWLRALETGRIGGAALLPAMTAGSRLNDGTPITYSYGLQVERDQNGVHGLTRIGHGGQTAAYRSHFSYFPGRGFGVILLCNVSNAPLGAAQEAVNAWLEANFPSPPPAESVGQPAAAEPLAAEQAAAFAGSYHDPVGDSVQTFAAENGELRLVYFGQPYPLAFLGDGRFALEGLAEFRFDQAAEGMRMIETGQGQPRTVYSRLMAPARVSAADYSGRYRSRDVDGEVEVRADGESLVVALPFGEARPAALAADRFSAPTSDLLHMAFTRDGSGRVDGFTLTTMSGITRLRFDRL